MKNLIISTLLTVLLYSCINSNNNDNLPKPLTQKDSLSVFKDLKLPKDSLNFTIKMGDKIKIGLLNSKDTIIVEAVEVSRFCFLGETSCDVPARIIIKLHLNNTTFTLPLLYLNDGNGTKKDIKPTVGCNPDTNLSDWYFVIGNLIFSAKEITPYTNSRDENLYLLLNKLYYLNLTILNKCTK